MKKLIVIIAAGAALAGCATPGPGPANYGTRGYAQSGDPSQWQVVSVTPVPLGTGERAGDAGVVTSSPIVVNPAPPGAYVPQPVYGYPPVYVQEPYWYPPVSIGLGLSFGRSWGGHRHHHHRGDFRRR
ncbi:MAG: hypothetical protein V7631_1446 [Massilia sp.]|jgi:hypothetical protein